ncbi:unnamed protein product [Sphagnum balticum]
MKELTAHELKRILNSQLVFEPVKYQQSEQKKEYLNDLLNYMRVRVRNKQVTPHTGNRNRSLNPEDKLNQTVGQSRPTTKLPHISPKSN